MLCKRSRPFKAGFLFIALALSGCIKMAISGASGAGAREEYALGTYCRLDLFENGSNKLYGRLFDRLAELDFIFNAYRDDSELVRVNQNAGLEPVELSLELFTVLERALFFAENTGGAFDPTVGPLVKLWGIGANNPQVPQAGQIRSSMDLVNWQNVEITPQTQELVDSTAPGTAFLKRQGMALDLGAIAKGYAADELVKILREEEIPRALINLGGNVYVWGNKADGSPWRIGVQDPLGERGSYAGFLELTNDISVVCSGIYERFFTGSDGRRYHHIMGLKEDETTGNEETLGTNKNPKGYPVDNGILSVTVIAASSMDADALSTSSFVLGYKKGLALAAEYEAEILFIFEDKTIRGSPGAIAVFTVTDDSYRMLR